MPRASPPCGTWPRSSVGAPAPRPAPACGGCGRWWRACASAVRPARSSRCCATRASCTPPPTTTTSGWPPRTWTRRPTGRRSIHCSTAAPSAGENAYHVAMPSVTLSDVAREAGVSLATASRAINGSANRTVRPELGERVLAAAARLGYSPDANAQAMARGRTTTLGLIVHDIADPYFSSIAAGVSAAAEEEGLMVTLASTAHRPERETALLEMLQSQRARAIVIAGGRQDDAKTTDALRAAVAAYEDRGGTVALSAQPILQGNTVAIANTVGAAALARALVEIGYREFAILTGPRTHLTGAERTTGFAGAVADEGLSVPEAALVECAFTRDGGYAGMAELLRTGPKVQAVFA